MIGCIVVVNWPQSELELPEWDVDSEVHVHFINGSQTVQIHGDAHLHPLPTEQGTQGLVVPGK